MEFRVLGALEVWERGRPLSLGGAKQRAVLAILLLRANEVVSRDMLIDELWGESPPPSAAHTLDAYVSRLRKTLHADLAGDAILLTRPGGYMLRAGFGELDLYRFERLLEEGRRALATRAFERAAAKLQEALALWRGRTLADLEFEQFARTEIDRIEELRLQAQEELVEAELALGHHQALNPELEALVAQNPLRERLRGQLMLALYRSGRQADALQAYRETHSFLAQELGIEPGPALKAIQRAILHQEDNLELPGAGDIAPIVPPPPPSPRAEEQPKARPLRRPRARPLVVVGAGAAAALVAAAVAISLALIGSHEAVSAVDENALALVGADATIRGKVTLPSAPTRVAVGFGALWVTSFDAQTVLRVDPRRREVRKRIAVGSGPTGAAVGGGAVWVANNLDGTVSRIDPATDEVVQTIDVGSRPTDVAYAAGSLWVASATAEAVLRIDPGRKPRTIALDAAPTALAAGGGSVWAGSESGRTVTQIDTSTNSIKRTIPVGGGPAGMAFVGKGLWVANSLDGTVSRIDLERGVVTRTIPVGNGPVAIAASLSDLWVTNEYGATVTRLDPTTARVLGRSHVGSRPDGVAAAGEGDVWVAVRQAGASHRGRTLRLLTSASSFRSLDPAFFTELQPGQLFGMTNDGLVTFKHVGGSDGVQLVPDLAVSLPTLAARGTRYSFTLRPGIRYSTGHPLRASDVRATFERLFKAGSPGTGFYSSIIGARGCASRPKTCTLLRGITTDDRDGSVTFHLSRPDPEFLYKLTLTYAYVLPAGTPARDSGLRPLPATGPYMIEPPRSRRVLLVRNPAFHEWSEAAQPDGYPDAILWKFGVKPGNAVTEIEHGRADWMLDLDFSALPLDRRREVATKSANQLHVNPLLGTHYMVLNTKSRPFDDVRARRAVNYALDRGSLVTLYGGPAAAAPTCQILPPLMGGYRRYCPYRRDLVRARRLVASSGTRGLEVLVWDTRTPSIYYKEGVAVVRALRGIGYRARLKIVPLAAWGRATAARSSVMQVISGGWAADYPAASDFIELRLSCRELRSSDFIDNPWFCDHAIDRQIDRALALQVARPQEANALWAEIDRELVNRAVWLPTVTPKTSDFVSKRVGNYQYHPLWKVLIDQIWVR